MEALLSSGWPAFISADRVAEKHLPLVRERFTLVELVVLDEEVPVDVAQLEEWTGMALPALGAYVIPGGLSTLSVDREADEGI